MGRTEQNLNLYEISDKYILFLQNFKELTHIYNPASVKPLCGNYTQHTRKYIGVVIKIETDDKKIFNQFAPLSSVKDKDYLLDDNANRLLDADGCCIPRPDSMTIIRLCSKGNVLGKVLLANMIPVPETELNKYDLKNEPDKKYAAKVKEEIRCMRRKQGVICKNAVILYKQKCGKTDLSQLYPYLKRTIPFKLAETKCCEFIQRDK